MSGDEMDIVHEKVIELKSRVDRHGEAILRLEQAGTQAEKQISELSDTVKTFVNSAKLLVWTVGIIVVAAQSGILAAIKLALGV
jgi:hypothetical protein